MNILLTEEDLIIDVFAKVKVWKMFTFKIRFKTSHMQFHAKMPWTFLLKHHAALKLFHP